MSGQLKSLISTGSFAPAERLPQWRWFLRRVCGNFDVEAADPGEFSGEIVAATFGGLSYKTIAGSDSRLVRATAAAWRHGGDQLYFIVQMNGVSVLRQAGAEAILHPGEATLIDGGLPLEFLFRDGCRQFALHIPRPLLRAHCGPRTPRLATQIESNGYAKALVSLLVTTAEEASQFDVTSARLAMEQILTGISHLVCSDPGELAQPERQPARLSLGGVQNLIRRHLSDSNLTIERAASIAGMSSRKMQRLFQTAGVTYSEWRRTERLKRCYFELASCHDRDVSVTDIAFRWGFSDVSHFSRAFRTQFGACARDVRARALIDESGGAPVEQGSAEANRES